jgi:LysM repeat protein
VIRVGQTLHVSTADWYTVQPGDTLGGIAERMGTSDEALLRLNDIDTPDHLSVGQRLRVR